MESDKVQSNNASEASQASFETPKFHSIGSSLSLEQNNDDSLKQTKRFCGNKSQAFFNQRPISSFGQMPNVVDSIYTQAKDRCFKSLKIFPITFNLQQSLRLHNLQPIYSSLSLHNEKFDFQQEEYQKQFNPPFRNMIINNNVQVPSKKYSMKQKVKRKQRQVNQLIQQGLQLTKEIEKKTINFQSSQVSSKRLRTPKLQFWWQQRQIAKEDTILSRKRKDFKDILCKQNKNSILQYSDLKLSSEVLQVTLVIKEMSILQLNNYKLLKVRVFTGNAIYVQNDKIVIDQVQGYKLATVEKNAAGKLVNYSTKVVRMNVKMCF